LGVPAHVRVLELVVIAGPGTVLTALRGGLTGRTAGAFTGSRASSGRRRAAALAVSVGGRP
jgi:hypothetical protein